MKKTTILAIDQGTTATTVFLIDESLAVRSRFSVEFPQHFPGGGWVEHELEEIWGSVCAAIEGALDQGGVSPEEIAGVGIANQRETTALWEKETGRPLSRAIVWQDRRTTPLCNELREQGQEPRIREKTGLLLDPYFAGTKMRWFLDELPQVRERGARGELAFGTIDSFLIHRLSARARYVTDVSNASRTLLMNLKTLDWDPELLDLFGIPAEMLPAIVPSSGVCATTKGVGVLPDGLPIAGIAGDQQAALFGQACFGVGDSKCTYGTGAFLLTNIGPKPVASDARLLTTVGWKLASGEVAYALEGSAFVAGAAVQWLRDGLGIIEKSADVEALAAKVPDSGGVVFVPAFAGLGAPHWRPEARGAIIGLDRGTTSAHLARATLEGIAFQICELAEAMEKDTGASIRSFRVDGGAAANDLLLQIQADLLSQEVIRPKALDTTALGAGFLAGLGVGLWSSKEEIAQAWEEDRRFTPSGDDAWRTRLRAAWDSAVAKA